MFSAVTPATLAVFPLLLAVAALPSLVFTGLLVARRKMFPLSARELSLVLSAAAGIVFNLVVNAVRALTPLPCAFGMVPDLLVPAFAITCTLFRLFRLGFLHKFAQEKLSVHKRNSIIYTDKDDDAFPADDKEPSSGWFADHRHMVTRAWMWKLIIPIAFLIMLAAIVVYISATDLPAGGTDDSPCLRIQRMRYVSVAVSVTLVIGIVCTVWFVRNVHDGFFIKQEMKFLGVASVCAVVFNALQTQNVVLSPSFPLTELLMCLSYTGLLVASVWYPLYQSYAAQRSGVASGERGRSRGRGTQASRDADRLAGVPLVRLLTDDEFEEERQEFEQLLINEFSVENLLFFHAVRRFERLTTLVINTNASESGGRHIDDESPVAGIPTTRVDSKHSVSESDSYALSADVHRILVTTGSGRCEHLITPTRDDEGPVSVHRHARRALELYSWFLVRGAPYEVNVVYDDYKAVHEEITSKLDAELVEEFCASDAELWASIKIKVKNQIRSDTFTAANKHILSLLEKDAYLRWKIQRRAKAAVECDFRGNEASSSVGCSSQAVSIQGGEQDITSC